MGYAAMILAAVLNSVCNVVGNVTTVGSSERIRFAIR